MKPNWKAPFLDLTVPPPQRRRLLAAVERVLAHGRLVMGPEVSEFETRTAQACRREAAVGVSSGTDALILALHAAGIGPGDEVITTSLSWIATANAIAHRGATPVFADINTDLNIDPESVRRLISPRTRALLPVHFTGRICDMENAARHRPRTWITRDRRRVAGVRGAAPRSLSRRVWRFGLFQRESDEGLPGVRRSGVRRGRRRRADGADSPASLRRHDPPRRMCRARLQLAVGHIAGRDPAGASSRNRPHSRATASDRQRLPRAVRTMRRSAARRARGTARVVHVHHSKPIVATRCGTIWPNAASRPKFNTRF